MLNLAQAREVLAAAVATQGAFFVYNPGGTGFCAYQPLAVGAQMRDRSGAFATIAEGDPRTRTGCLAGIALDLAGIEFEHSSPDSVTHLLWWIPEHPRATEAAARYLQEAQEAQDSGASWGQALEQAERFARRVGFEGEFSDAAE